MTPTTFRLDVQPTSSTSESSFPLVTDGCLNVKSEPERQLRDLPEELWQRIFAQLPLRVGDTASVLPLRLVSQFWKSVSQPILFKHLEIDSSCLPGLAAHLTLPGPDGRTAGRWVQTLNIKHKSHDPSKPTLIRHTTLEHNALIGILSNTPNLRVFKSPICLPFNLVELLLIGARSTIMQLKVALNEDLVNSFRLLNEVTSLVDLWLVLYNSSSSQIADMPLRIPGVRDLGIHWTPEDPAQDAGSLMECFAKSRFAQGCGIRLRMPLLSRGEASRLLPLLEINKPSFVMLECPDDAVHTMCDVLKTVPQVMFPLSAPPPALFNAGHLPRTVTIGSPLAHIDKVWMFLQGLLSRQGGLAYTTRVCIGLHPPHRFSWWKSASHHEKLVTGHLLGHAIALKKMNIVLLDQDGYDLLSLMGSSHAQDGKSR